MTDLSPSKKPAIWLVLINKVGKDEASNGFTIYFYFIMFSFNWKKMQLILHVFFHKACKIEK